MDVTLIDALGNELDMGTAFDSFSEKVAVDFYEQEPDAEWWHYDFGDREWAACVGRPVLYRGAFSREEFILEELK